VLVPERIQEGTKKRGHPALVPDNRAQEEKRMGKTKGRAQQHKAVMASRPYLL